LEAYDLAGTLRGSGTGAQARIRKGGLAGIAKGEMIALLRPDDLLAIANVDERVA